MVFVTKFRHPVFTGTHLTRLDEITRSVCADFETELAEFNGEATHVHLLVNFPPKIALSKLVNSLKGVSSRWMRHRGTPPGPPGRFPGAGHRCRGAVRSQRGRKGGLLSSTPFAWMEGH
ncbi:IS200/IS605 family transposase [Nonomuraea helvata]|uniref:IS200/IS605 family transposase n=1 Tax=Nonomuraea helvata TaxID=37484 RepID=A0ABV5S1K2_9ACTN